MTSNQWYSIVRIALSAGGLILLCGCEPIDTSKPLPTRPQANALRGEESRASEPSDEVSGLPNRRYAARSDLVGQENWDVYYFGADRIGYGYTRWSAVPERDGLIAGEGLVRLPVKRFGQESVTEIKMSVVEDEMGDVREYASESQMGPSANTTMGKIEDGIAHTTVTVNGKTHTDRHLWPREARGYFALEEELFTNPPMPGERRTLRMLIPPSDQLGVYVLHAKGVEATDMLDGSHDLLRVDAELTLPGAKPFESIVWINPRGEILKMHTPNANLTVYRTTKEDALGARQENRFDFGYGLLVKMAKPIADPHQNREITYRVTLAGGNPTEAFVQDIAQRIVPIDDERAEITVRAIRPKTPLSVNTDGKATAGLNAPPTDAERQPSDFMQSDDPSIVKMANEVAGNVTDPWRIAVALERYVHAKVATKNYSQTFASAADVAATLEGDCTEHAVLLAALLRARGLPSRAALGLVYVPSSQAFAFHMWTEVYINDRWIGLDGTLGLGGIGAGHLKVSVSSLKEATALTDLLPIAQVMGRLKIEVSAMESLQ